MPKAIDITGQRFGLLVALHSTAKRDNDGNIRWLCRCDCGKLYLTTPHDLKRGFTKSCGCRQRNYKHGYTVNNIRHPLYSLWATMRNRCTRKSHPKFKYYGALGVKVCKRWDSFELFLADMGERPSDKHSLDRYPDRDGDYEPGNVRWASPLEQRHNRRDSKRPT